jgi:hypothetical protein
MFEPNDSWLDGLPEEPAFRRLEEDRGAERWADISRAEEIGLGWTLLVEDRAEQILDRAPGVPGFRWAAAALLDPEVDRDFDRQSQGFGVIFYVDDPHAERLRLEDIEIEGTALPIILRPISYEEHASIPSIPDGTVTCWATTAEGSREGWLTARHVALAGGYEMADCGRECIDAALVRLADEGGGSVARAVRPSVAARVEIQGPHPSVATVLDVAIELGISASSYFPLRFSTDAVGVEGDSGSLIVADPCREPVGIYLGSARLDSGRSSGIGLAIWQLERLMKMEVYL